MRPQLKHLTNRVEEVNHRDLVLVEATEYTADDDSSRGLWDRIVAFFTSRRRGFFYDHERSSFNRGEARTRIDSLRPPGF